MKEYKFRAYAGGVMVYFGLYDIMRQWNPDRIEDGFLTRSNLSVSGNNQTIMQYTGLKDSLAIEEYFGDIVRDAEDNLWLIKDACSAVIYGGITTKSDRYFWQMNTPHYVIGNKWSNPELLETR